MCRSRSIQTLDFLTENLVLTVVGCHGLPTAITEATATHRSFFHDVANIARTVLQARTIIWPVVVSNVVRYRGFFFRYNFLKCLTSVSMFRFDIAFRFAYECTRIVYKCFRVLFVVDEDAIPVSGVQFRTFVLSDVRNGVVSSRRHLYAWTIVVLPLPSASYFMRKSVSRRDFRTSTRLFACRWDLCVTIRTSYTPGTSVPIL